MDNCGKGKLYIKSRRCTLIFYPWRRDGPPADNVCGNRQRVGRQIGSILSLNRLDCSDAVLFHQAVKIGALHADLGGGAGHVPVVLGQRIQ